MLPIRVLATGHALPERVVTTAEVAALVGVDAVHAEAATGVKERRWALPDEDPVIYGARAMREALERAELSISDIDVLIHASGSVPQAIPDGSAAMADAIGFEAKPAFSIHSTCVSAMVALHQAALLIASGQARRILIVTCEASSRGLDFSDAESSLLFGDGAAAMVVGEAVREDQGIENYVSQMWPKGAGATEVRGGGYRYPAYTEGVDRRDFAFHMDGRRALMMAHKLVPAFLEQLRPGLSRGLAGVDVVIPHQTSAAGMKLLGRYNWPEDAVETTLAHLGNVIAASVPLTLHQALERGRIKEGSRVLLCGTGAGLTITGMVLRW